MLVFVAVEALLYLIALQDALLMPTEFFRKVIRSHLTVSVLSFPRE